MEEILEQGKPLRLPSPLFNFAIIVSEFPFPITVAISHSDALEPVLTLSACRDTGEEDLGDSGER